MNPEQILQDLRQAMYGAIDRGEIVKYGPLKSDSITIFCLRRDTFDKCESEMSFAFAQGDAVEAMRIWNTAREEVIGEYVRDFFAQWVEHMHKGAA